MNKLVDTHAHLDSTEYEGIRAEVVSRAHEAGVETIITIGTDIELSKKAIEIAKEYPGVYAAIALHPGDTAKKDVEEVMSQLDALIVPENKIVAIGETGIDYFRTAPGDFKKERASQIRFLTEHIGLAKKHHLPVIIHVRGDHAYDDVIHVLAGNSGVRCVIHSYGGTLSEMKLLVDMGMYISISGIVTFKNALELQEVVKNIPTERLLLETDSPFLTPEPFRGKINEPSYVHYVAQKVAELRGVTIDEIAESTSKNAVSLFNI